MSVLRGHSIFSSLPQRPMTSDFEGFSIPDFIHYIYFPALDASTLPLGYRGGGIILVYLIAQFIISFTCRFLCDTLPIKPVVTLQQKSNVPSIFDSTIYYLLLCTPMLYTSLLNGIKSYDTIQLTSSSPH